MKETNKRHILLRYSIVIGLMLLLAAFIVYFLLKTTVIHSSEWNAKADSLITKEKILYPERGQILSDSGTVLAANLHYYTARIDWTAPGVSVDTLQKYLPALADSLHRFDPRRSADRWADTLLAAAKAKKNTSFMLERNLTHAQFERLKTFPFLKLKKNRSGFYYESVRKRTKPYGSMASRSIGNVRDTMLRGVAGLHGITGLESALDSLLYGEPGVAKRIQVTSNLVNWESVPAKRGYDITTTINVALQDIVEGELYKMCVETGAEWGTCVLMEVATGEIKAISNLEKTKSGDDYIEGVNNAVLGVEPGSVMKPISMMMALEDGIVGDINTPIPTGTSFMYYGRPINDPHGGAALSPRQIIETSSNVGMSRIIIKKYDADPYKFIDRLREMGFMDRFHSGIAGERVPKFPPAATSREMHVALTRMCYGYTSEVPPLYTLAMYNAIANNGRFVRPHLVKKLSRAGEPDSIVPITYVRDHVCSPENAEKLRIMLHDVVWGSRGTARRWVQDPHVEIAGKTGTAYVVSPITHQYTTQKRLAFCGFFPYKKPKYSCIVLMCGADRGAGASSGVVLKNIALKMFARGMLDMPSSYLAGEQRPANAAPTFVASASKTRSKTLRRLVNTRSSKSFETPHALGGVPNVKGLSAREAIVALEKAGFNVLLNGVGHVVAQSAPAGSSLTRGTVVTLQLRH